MPNTRPHKPELRERALTSRAALPAPTRAAAAAEIRRRLADLPELRAASCVLAYAAFGDEVDLDALLERLLESGATVLLPYVEGDALHCAPVGSLPDLAPGFRGVREPAAPARQATDPRLIDVALVPGVAFDRKGGRLGYGGGHFDRLLAQLRPDANVVGIAYHAQLFDAVPIEPHDRRVDIVVTEEGNLRVGG